jgi:hypothetical protein
MKRSISTILVVLVLMNVMGYYGLLVGLQYRNAQNLITQINAGAFSDADTESLKIPVPGNPGSQEYDRVDGEFEKDGQVFRLVKQRLYKDTFHIVFIRDEMGTLIKHALADYSKSFSEKTQDDDHQLIILPIFLREYLSKTSEFLSALQPGSKVVNTPTSRVFVDCFDVSIIHPPERA